MKNIFSPQNNLFVTIAKKYYDTITYESGVTLYKDTGFHPEESAMMEAFVLSVPTSIVRRADYEGFTELPAPGDTILMRYDVVFAYKDQPDRDTPIYKNMLYFNGQELWMVDIMQVFAVKTADGYRMLNGYVLCDIIEGADVAHATLWTPTTERKDRMRVRFIGLSEVQCGDMVTCRAGVAQRYIIGTDAFYIIKQSHILSVDCANECAVD